MSLGSRAPWRPPNECPVSASVDVSMRFCHDEKSCASVLVGFWFVVLEGEEEGEEGISQRMGEVCAEREPDETRDENAVKVS